MSAPPERLTDLEVSVAPLGALQVQETMSSGRLLVSHLMRAATTFEP